MNLFAYDIGLTSWPRFMHTLRGRPSRELVTIGHSGQHVTATLRQGGGVFKSPLRHVEMFVNADLERAELHRAKLGGANLSGTSPSDLKP